MGGEARNNNITVIYSFFRFSVYIFVDIEKRCVLSLVGEIRCNRNDRFHRSGWLLCRWQWLALWAGKRREAGAMTQFPSRSYDYTSHYYCSVGARTKERRL